MLPDKIAYPTKKSKNIQYCKFCKPQFLSKWKTLNLNWLSNYLMQIMYHLHTKNTFLSKHNYIQAFPVELHENANENNNFRTFFEDMISSNSVSSLSILIKARSNNLPWLIVSHWGPEIWMDQFHFTENSFAACNTYSHHQHYLQSNSKNVRKAPGRDSFEWHDLKPAFCNLEFSRLIACHLHLCCTQLLNCRI